MKIPSPEEPSAHRHPDHEHPPPTQESSESARPAAAVRKSLTDIFLGYRQILRRLVGSMVRPEDIDDIVQETFIRAYQSGLKSEIKHPKTYLYKAARNLALNHRRKKSFESLGDALESFDALAAENDDNLEARVISDEKFRLFCSALRELPPQCRRVFILKRIYGLNQKDIAAQLGISERTVEVHVAKGIARCASYLRDKGYSIYPDAKSAPATSSGGAKKPRLNTKD